jgi:hypothetical protein
MPERSVANEVDRDMCHASMSDTVDYAYCYRVSWPLRHRSDCEFASLQQFSSFVIYLFIFGSFNGADDLISN